MAIFQTIDEQLARIATGNRLYTYNKNQWRYLLESYMGGDDYKRGQHLTHYAMETAQEYDARIQSTPLENHTKAVVDVYNSFIFREEPERDFGSMAGLPEIDAFLEDCDLDDRDMNSFMKDVATWSSVFGHCWVLVVKPNIGAITKADELAAGVRPYLSLLTPLTVLDWHWQRSSTGKYDLKRLKYVEDVNGSVQTIKEWTPETITTWNVDFDNRLIINELIEPNGIGKIPAVVAYANRSEVRGLGVSDITDIADLQKFIYNLTSEAEQTVRMDSHPSLVKTPETQVSTGAGSIIQMPENMDPALKPYLLEYNGASVDSIMKSIEHATSLIDTLSNTASVRATSAKVLSGIAMQTEFQLLNARLSNKADALELAEEKIWQLFAEYQGYTWDGEIEYENQYQIQAEETEYVKLQTAKSAASTPAALAYIDSKLISLLCDDLADEDMDEMDYMAMDPAALLMSMQGYQLPNSPVVGAEDPAAVWPQVGGPLGSSTNPAGESQTQQTIPTNNRDPILQKAAVKLGRRGPGSVAVMGRNPLNQVDNTAQSDMIMSTAMRTKNVNKLPKNTPPNAQ